MMAEEILPVLPGGGNLTLLAYLLKVRARDNLRGDVVRMLRADPEAAEIGEWKMLARLLRRRGASHEQVSEARKIWAAFLLARRYVPVSAGRQ
jgi:hypothetical protein